MDIKQRYQFVIQYFLENSKDAKTELIYEDPFQLLVAVILSAQCTDKRVNLTTPLLFEKFPDANAMAHASFEDIFSLIKSITYPNNKAKHLIGMAKQIREEFHGKIPMKVSELMKLPGVGRKTANVITSVLDKQPNMAVDTHVFRVSKRIGLVRNAKTPLEVEKQLTAHFPKQYIHDAHHWLILHGRYTCTARNPKCETCGIQKACKYFVSLPTTD
jgi:endonuclease-3